jgi:hypothetical protein
MGDKGKLLNWETIEKSKLKAKFLSTDSNVRLLTRRLKVPGGWLVYHTETTLSWGLGGNMVFLPDPKHEWDPNAQY